MLTGDSEDVARAVSERNSVLTSTSRRSCPRRRTRRSNNSSPKENSSRWSATASTTHRRSREQTSVSPSARGPMSPSSRGYHPRRQQPAGRGAAHPTVEASYRKMQENLVWATGYNVFALPACGGNPRSHRHPPVAGDRRRVHVAVDDHRRDQRSQTGERRPLSTCRNPQSQPCQSLRQCCSGLDSCPGDTTRWASRSYPEPVRPVLAPRHPQLDVLARVDSMDRRTRDSVWSIVRVYPQNDFATLS